MTKNGVVEKIEIKERLNELQEYLSKVIDVMKMKIVFYEYIERMNPHKLTNGVLKYFLNKIDKAWVEERKTELGKEGKSLNE